MKKMAILFTCVLGLLSPLLIYAQQDQPSQKGKFPTQFDFDIIDLVSETIAIPNTMTHPYDPGQLRFMTVDMITMILADKTTFSLDCKRPVSCRSEQTSNFVRHGDPTKLRSCSMMGFINFESAAECSDFVKAALLITDGGKIARFSVDRKRVFLNMESITPTRRTTAP